MSEPTTVAEVLRRAADILDENGWGQGWLIDPDGGSCACAVGAIQLASGMTPQEIRYGGLTKELAVRATRFFSAVLKSTVSAWNDEPGRTAEEVIAKLREAAELAS